MEKKTKQAMGLITFGVVLFAALMNFQTVLLFLKNVLGLVIPLLVGSVLAFVLSVPMKGFEKMFLCLCRKCRRSPKEKRITIASLFCTLVTIVCVLILVFSIVVPEIISSVKGIGLLIQDKWPMWAAALKEYNVDTTAITSWVESLDIEHIILNVVNSAGVVINGIAGTAASTISVFTKIMLSFVVMFYVLLSKKDLAIQCKKILYANLKKETADKLVYLGSLVRDTYTKFLSGQCIEAVILGVLMFCAFNLFRLPYASLISILTTVCAFVPYVGAFISCAVGVFLTLLTNPLQAILCLIVYQVVQFIENQFIYPRVVGNSVGLSPLWTFAAVMVGGKLFGLVGVLFFIPLTAVIYVLIRDNTNKKLAKKQISITKKKMGEDTK